MEKYSISSKEYKRLMAFIMQTGLSLTELVSSDESYYRNIRNKVLRDVQTIKFYKVLDRCRDIIVNRHAGENVLRYLLYKMKF